MIVAGGTARRSAPYGVAVHVADLLGVLDDAGVRRAALVGHSMGAFVIARLRPNGQSARATRSSVQPSHACA